MFLEKSIQEVEKEFLANYNPEVTSLATNLMERILMLLPTSQAHWLDAGNKIIGFGTAKNMKGTILYIKPLKDSVNLGFFQGTSLTDSQTLLKGTGKNLRHIKLKKLSELDNEAIWQLVQEALAFKT